MMHQALTASPLGRRLAVATGAVIIALTICVALLPGQAQASSSGCVWSQSTPESCISVVGHSTYVNSITAGVNVGPRQVANGYFRVWGAGFSVNTTSVTRWNQSYWHDHLYWNPVVQLNRNLPDKSKVCVAFHDASRGWRNGACETIYR